MRTNEDLERFVPEDVRANYDVMSVRGAAALLHTMQPDLYAEVLTALRAFTFPEALAVKAGGNGSEITATFKALLTPKGWKETRIAADLLVKKYHGARKKVPVEQYTLPGYVDGHKIDFVKDRVAVDFEWNSKDQTYDRDLYAARAFYECGAIDVFVIVTRSAKLNPLFERLGISKKYGASTTFMGKLEPRLLSGRNGGCPVLAFGITPSIVTASNPDELVKAAATPEAPDEEDDDA